MAKDPYRYFRIEAGELLQQLAKAALDLEKSADSTEPVLRLLRLAHTLKGAARVVRLPDMADLSHAVEESLSPYRDSTQPVPRERVDQVLAAVDSMTAKLAELNAPATHPAPPASQPAVPATHGGLDAPLRLARADVAEVDLVLEGLSEVGNELEALKRLDTSLEKLRDLSQQLTRHAQLPQKKLSAIANDLLAVADHIERHLRNGAERAQRELRDTRDAAQRLRLVPVVSIFNALERTARDAAHETGKQLHFEAHGGDVRIESDVLDTVQSAMIQLVRNALAHGIETPAQRQQVNKPAAGKLTIDVRRLGHYAHFRCSDDGAGIDLAAVRRALAAKGKAQHEIDALNATSLISLLLEGGISTSTKVDELSGRGIGLDLARTAAANLHGKLLAQSTPGEGTSIELRVPLTLAGLQVLMFMHQEQHLSVPLDSVQRTLRLTPDAILRMPDGDSIIVDGVQIPLLSLNTGDKQRTSRYSAERPVTVIVIGNVNGLCAVAVDRLLGMEHIVLRPLPALTPAEPIVLGLHLDIEGNPRLVLDPEQLKSHMQRRSVQDAVDAAAATMHPILIVDDSLTTRMLECSILESAGFTVEMAASAEEGLEMAERKPYALFLVDVEMPGMNGFEFVARTRAHPGLSGTPCILVTSRDAPEDLQRGRDSGASDYIVKGEFDQTRFVQRVRELVQP